MLNQTHIAWITDPWDTLDHSKDTTLRLIEEASQLGVKQSWCNVKSIRLEQGQILMDAHPILEVLSSRGSEDFKLAPAIPTRPSQFSHLHYRTDPPVNEDYLYPLHMLALDLPSSHPSQVINPLPILLGHNEKMEAFALPDLMPPTLVSCSWESLLSFGKGHSKTVLKPLNEAQSKGIELLQWNDSSSLQHARAQIERLSHGFQTPVLLQAYLEDIHQGETRLWFLDGTLLGCIKKLPLAHDFRVNLDRGSLLEVTSLTQDQEQISKRIGSHLQKLGIRLAAVDLIGRWITDFNFTSPGLITQMEKLLNENLAKKIIQKTLSTP